MNYRTVWALVALYSVLEVVGIIAGALALAPTLAAS